MVELPVCYFEPMVIAVYADLKDDPSAEYNLYFLKSLLENLAIAYPQHEIYLIVSNDVMDGFDETLVQVISLHLQSSFFHQFLLEQKVLKTIKDIKADRLFSYDKVFKTAISQFVLIGDVVKNKKFNVKTLQKATAIFVLAESEKTFLFNNYKLDPQKIKTIYGGYSKLFASIPDELRESVKEKYTNGKEYFIYRGAIEKRQNIIPLLKAFSIFKKRQKSSMKLLLMGKLLWNTEFDKLIGSYKYREDVVIITDASLIDQAQIVAAAYAYIQPYSNNFLLFSFDALRSGVPVLIDNSIAKEIFLDAALYFESANDADIADKMMLVYKDESLRSQLIEKGKKNVESYTWEKTINILGQNLQLSGTD